MKNIILDTDIGDDIDDALALTVALHAANLDVRGVVTVYDEVDIRARITAKLLEAAGRNDIPVAAGLGEPLKKRPPHMGFITSQAVILDGGESFPAISNTPGVEFMKHMLDESEEPLTLTGIGPLTNIASLLMQYPECKSKIEEIVIMGSYFGREVAEWNMLLDPEAAQTVYHAGIPMRVVPFDISVNCLMAMPLLEALGSDRRPYFQYVNAMTRGWMARFEKTQPVLHDPLAIGCLAAPELFEFTPMDVEVDLSPTPHYGVTRARENEESIVQVCTAVDYDAFAEFFAAHFLGTELVQQGC